MEAKKNPKFDLNRWYVTFFNLGLSASILLVLWAFTYATTEPGVKDLGEVSDYDEMLKIVNTVVEEPERPKPKIIEPEFIPVPEEETPIEFPDLDFPEFDDSYDYSELVADEPEEEEISDEPFLVLENPAEYIGGTDAMFKFLYSRLKYPSRARRLGISGRITITFVIERDGSVSNATVIKGLGAGLDEVALEAVNAMPKWKPGKQRGNPVRQRISIPITFRLE